MGAYLRGRGLDLAAISDGVARALPSGALPAWAAMGPHSWQATGHRLILPLYDAAGAMRSLLARKVRAPSPATSSGKQPPKSIGPSGYERGGLVMADGLAEQLLLDGAPPAWWEDRPLRVLVVEGEIDFMTYAAHHYGEPWAPALLGIVSGSWTAGIAARIPDGATLAIATHADDAGEKYAKKITDLVAPRIRAGTITAERILLGAQA